MGQGYDRVALVSAGSRGIGAATVARLAADGWNVSFSYSRDGQSAVEAEKAASELGARVLAVQADVTEAAEVASWVRQAEDLGPVGALVSCAGISRDRPLAHLESADWRALTDTSLDGLFHLCRAVMPAMMSRSWGRIVAVSSVSAVYGPEGRAGVAGFTRALASQTARYGIQVNALVPAAVSAEETAIWPEGARAQLTEMIAVRRFASAAAVAGRVAFLLSDAAGDLTGTVLEVPGGIETLGRPHRGAHAVNVTVSDAARRAFLAERRAASVLRFDTLHSPHYDEHWGAISPSHAAFVARLAGLVRPGGTVLDAACGTGKYWPALLAAGLRVTGSDQSEGMLAQARRKHPGVPTRVLALQDLARQNLRKQGLGERFDGLICVDALENVPPEDWPRVAAGLAGVLGAGAPGYVTVELPDGPLPPPADPRQVPGEVTDGGGYHYYPPRDRVRGWLEAAGFALTDQADADHYWHLLLARTTDR